MQNKTKHNNKYCTKIDSLLRESMHLQKHLPQLQIN